MDRFRQKARPATTHSST